uniref:Uncharacterized protein n=1 Tax=Anopheles melas TaxID=34690 RepID=A0A182TQQ8_9DIPT
MTRTTTTTTTTAMMSVAVSVMDVSTAAVVMVAAATVVDISTASHHHRRSTSTAASTATERCRIDNERMGRPGLLRPGRYDGDLPARLRPRHVRLDRVRKQHPLAGGRFHHRHGDGHVHVLLRRHLQRWLHRRTTDDHVLRGARHRLIAGRAQYTRHELVLERIRPGIAVLAAHVTPAVDLVQMVVVGRGALAHNPLHLSTRWASVANEWFRASPGVMRRSWSIVSMRFSRSINSRRSVFSASSCPPSMSVGTFTCPISSRQLKMYLRASLLLLFVSASCSSGVFNRQNGYVESTSR